MKTPVELFTDKIIMSLDGLHTPNLPRKIDDPKFTILANYTVVLDVIFQKYSQELFLEDVICKNGSSSISESIISKFTMLRSVI